MVAPHPATCSSAASGAPVNSECPALRSRRYCIVAVGCVMTSKRLVPCGQDIQQFIVLAACRSSHACIHMLVMGATPRSLRTLVAEQSFHKVCTEHNTTL